MGSDSFDISDEAVWNAWVSFRRGKKISREIMEFEVRLLDNLVDLKKDVVSGAYEHGHYRHIEIYEKKRRDLAVAPVRDRIVHRLLYKLLVEKFDKTFLYDVWSCRAGKGLIGCVNRTKDLFVRHRAGYFWRADVVKFFDHVQHSTLLHLLDRKIVDPIVRNLLGKVIASYAIENCKGGGRYESTRYTNW